MQRFIFTLAAFFMACLYLLPANAQDNKAQQTIRLHADAPVFWKLKEGAKTYEFNEMIIKLTPTSDGEAMQFDILKKGEEPISFSEKGSSGTITIGHFSTTSDNSDSASTPYNVALSVYSGYGTCCTNVYVTDYSFGAKLLKIGNFEGYPALPQDINGDGIMEYVDYDDRFNQITYFSQELPPLKIYSIENGEVIDATFDERFIAAHERHYKKQSIACARMTFKHPRPRIGSCVGLLGTAAYLGVYESTLNTLTFYLNDEVNYPFSAPYHICADKNCRKRQKFDEVEPALDFALRNWGYLPNHFIESEDVTRFLTALTTTTFGENEQTCDENPIEFKTNWNANSHKFYEFLNGDTKCMFEKGTMIGTSFLTKAVCTNDEQIPWLENHIYNFDGKQLVYSSFTSTRFGDMVVQNIKACKN